MFFLSILSLCCSDSGPSLSSFCFLPTFCLSAKSLAPPISLPHFLLSPTARELSLLTRISYFAQNSPDSRLSTEKRGHWRKGKQCESERKKYIDVPGLSMRGAVWYVVTPIRTLLAVSVRVSDSQSSTNCVLKRSLQVWGLGLISLPAT